MITISELNENFQKAMHEIQDHYENMLKENTKMFQAQTDHNELWTLYTQLLNKANMNPTYHEYPYHECSNCKKFMNTHGNIIFIKKDNNTLTLHSIFDINTETKYKQIFKELNEYIIQKPILNAYHPTEKVVGTPHNLELLDNGTIIEHHHFSLTTPNYNQINPTAYKGGIQTNKNLLEKTLNTINTDTVNEVIELINQNNLYRGQQYHNQLTQLYNDMHSYKDTNDKTNLLWYLASNRSEGYCHLINTVMGELLTNIQKGTPTEKAVTIYERMVAPANYQRPKPLVTEAMIEKARQTIEELGYLDSLKRRFATLDDIPVQKVLWSNKEKQKQDIFHELKKEAIHKPQEFNNPHTPTLTFNEFIEKIKTETSIEIYVSNSLTPNFVTLTTSNNPDSKHLFKWNNPLAWSYKGNLADSDIKTNVKKAGGNITGDLRFSIQWNDTNDYYSTSDLDAHCLEPDTYALHEDGHIYFGHKKSPLTGGFLDVDITDPLPNVPAVENITHPDKSRMTQGQYTFYVKCYQYNGGNKGFNAEIEYDNTIRRYSYPHTIPNKQRITVATVTLDEEGKFSIKEHIPSTQENKKIWNIQLNTFQPVTIITTSPNTWDYKGGHKHIFFILKDCICDEEVNGYYNEYLNYDLKKHKKVIELLSSKTRITPQQEQVSGLGFTRNTTLTTRINNKIYNVKI